MTMKVIVSRSLKGGLSFLQRHTNFPAINKKFKLFCNTYSTL